MWTDPAKAMPNGTLGPEYPCNCRLAGDMCVCVCVCVCVCGCVCDSSMGEWQACDSNPLELQNELWPAKL